MSIMNMPPLPYVKRIPGFDYEALKPAYTDPPYGKFRSGLAHALQPGSAGDPSAGRKGQCAEGDAADQFQGREIRQREMQPILRQLEQEIDAIRYDPGDGARPSCR